MATWPADDGTRAAPSSVAKSLFRVVEIVADDLSALHDEFDTLQLRNVSERIAADSDQIGEFTFFDGSDLVLPPQGFRVGHGSCLDRPGGCHIAVFDESLKFESLSPVGESGAIGPAAYHELDTLGGGRHSHGPLETGNHPIF